MIPICGFCLRDTVLKSDVAFMFSVGDRDYVSLDTPVVGNSVFMIVSQEEWDAHQLVMKPTVI